MIEAISLAFVIGLFCGVMLMHSSQKQKPTSVLFFPDKKLPCYGFFSSLKSGKKLNCIKNRACGFAHGGSYDDETSFIQILRQLNQATKKLDICMYLITYDCMAHFLMNLSTSRGIKIRIITDSNCDAADKSEKRSNDQSENLSRSGIQIKSNAGGTSALMHNKFAIVDDEQLLFGSFNWTKNAILNNHESVVILNTPDVVNKFKHEFNRLWNTLSTKKFSATAVETRAIALNLL